MLMTASLWQLTPLQFRTKSATQLCYCIPINIANLVVLWSASISVFGPQTQLLLVSVPRSIGQLRSSLLDSCCYYSFELAAMIQVEVAYITLDS